MNTNVIIESYRGYDLVKPEDKLLSSRMIFFTEEVTPTSSVELIELLLHLESEDPDKEITLFINSPGGEVASGLGVYDAIRGLKCPVRTVCIGTAASMGSILFLAGDKREMLPHTQVMIHDPLVNGLSGAQKALALEKEAEKLMKTREVIAGIIAERTGHTLEEVYEKTKDDCYMDAQECVSWNIATNITETINRKDNDYEQ